MCNGLGQVAIERRERESDDKREKEFRKKGKSTQWPKTSCNREVRAREMARERNCFDKGEIGA